MALISKLYQPNDDIRNCNATFHIGNSHALDAVVKNTATPTVIIAMAHLIWRRIRDLGITAWSEWVHGAPNISDIPTREVAIPFKCDRRMEFKNLRELPDIARGDTQALESDRPIIAPNTFQ